MTDERKSLPALSRARARGAAAPGRRGDPRGRAPRRRCPARAARRAERAAALVFPACGGCSHRSRRGGDGSCGASEQRRRSRGSARRNAAGENRGGTASGGEPPRSLRWIRNRSRGKSCARSATAVRADDVQKPRRLPLRQRRAAEASGRRAPSVKCAKRRRRGRRCARWPSRRPAVCSLPRGIAGAMVAGDRRPQAARQARRGGKEGSPSSASATRTTGFPRRSWRSSRCASVMSRM